MSAKMTAILAILLACAIENSQPDNKLSRDFNTASTGDHLSPQTQQFKRRFGISACHQVSKTWALKTRRYQDAFATIWDYEYMGKPYIACFQCYCFWFRTCCLLTKWGRLFFSLSHQFIYQFLYVPSGQLARFHLDCWFSFSECFKSTNDYPFLIEAHFRIFFLLR